ncbi:hypothetical protein K8I31_11645 [bacterium]|nr:hypothetical protein [bacterium]
MNLSKITEPENIKQKMRELKQTTFADDKSDIDWDSSIVWAGNLLPKYFWDNWKIELKDRGFTWQSFSKLLGYQTDKIILWFRNELTWKELVREIVKVMDSSIGGDLCLIPRGKRMLGVPGNVTPTDIEKLKKVK